MSVIITSDNFEKEAKRLIEKYRSLAQEIATLIQNLAENPNLGTPIGQECYKIGWPLKVRTRAKVAVRG